jgi:hypothetical protein
LGAGAGTSGSASSNGGGGAGGVNQTGSFETLWTQTSNGAIAGPGSGGGGSTIATTGGAASNYGGGGGGGGGSGGVGGAGKQGIIVITYTLAVPAKSRGYIIGSLLLGLAAANHSLSAVSGAITSFFSRLKAGTKWQPLASHR